MPHCRAWTPSDWAYAFDAAQLAALFHSGDLRAEAGLRSREKVMGVTSDARRSLRIVYVDVNPEDDDDEDRQPDLVSFEDYRRALEDGAGLIS